LQIPLKEGLGGEVGPQTDRVHYLTTTSVLKNLDIWGPSWGEGPEQTSTHQSTIHWMDGRWPVTTTLSCG